MKTDFFNLFEPYFSKSEKWGDLSQIKWWHIHHLYSIRIAMREKYDWPMIIHCSYSETGHSKNSYHYSGMATDFHFETSVDFLLQYGILKKILVDLGLWFFVGLGAYPEWNNPGFHLDGRGDPLQWVRANGKYYYGENNLIQIVSSYETKKDQTTQAL